MTRLLGDKDRELEEDFGVHGRGFPPSIPKLNHYHKEPQQYHKPYTEDPELYSNIIKPPLIQAHHDPTPYHKANKNLGNLLENSIGGAFYDREHDLVVSYKVRRGN